MVTIGDIVLVDYENKPAFFARIEEILNDHKPNWFHVRLLVLQVPVVEIVWILRREYIDGDPFTMDGNSVRMKLVTGPDESLRRGEAGKRDARHDENKNGKVIPLFGKK